eukprot:CAMPEP_0197060900 /NCGR_PEP_ID=MMETSP1384-20130603/131597_1 /TAXON_ID=29189 /ORGANISM="Ammonia sp." /LENGTH=46 /DNA_ID= /DNA_START= /DNA_END= /DNA_ORIENTATION=
MVRGQEQMDMSALDKSLDESSKKTKAAAAEEEAEDAAVGEAEVDRE